MLNQQSYTAKREKLTQDIAEAQREVDAALAETEGRTDARVHALKHALSSRQQQLVDLDAAWKASQPEVARQQAAANVERRKAALATVERTLANGRQAIAELHAMAARYRELMATCKASDQTVRRTLMAFAQGVHGRDAVDILPSLAPDDDELTEVLAGRLDLTSRVAARSVRITTMAERLVFPTPASAYEVITEEITP